MTDARDAHPPSTKNTHWTARWRRYDVLPWVVTAIVLAGAGTLSGLYALWVYMHEMVVIEMRLSSDDLEHRKRGAWRMLDHPREKWVQRMIAGIEGAEPEPDVREAYVYALGRLAQPRFLPVVESALEFDTAGVVRCAAWLALARVDPAQFRTLAEARPPDADAWDQIGVAQGWLELHDTRGVNRLLAFARAESPTHQEIASRSLFKGLKPLLDSVGRWPLDAAVSIGDLWPRNLVEELERRCAAMDLQRIADSHQRFADSMEHVQIEVKRLTRARDRLARLLFER